MTTTRTPARIEADEKVPMIHIYRDFAATPAQLFRAHTDPELFAAVGRTDRHRRRHRLLGRPRRRRVALHGIPGRGVHDGVPRLLPHGEPRADRADLHLGGACPRAWRSRRSPSRTSATGAPACTRPACATRSRRATSGSPAAWRPGSTRATTRSTALLAGGRAVTGIPTAPDGAPPEPSPAGSPTRCGRRATGTPRRRCRSGPPATSSRHLVGVVPRLPQLGQRDRAARGAGRRRRPGAGVADPRGCRAGAARRPGHRRSASSRTRTPATCRWTRRSTASTRPTCSCTPGTSPARPARTTPSTRPCAPSCSRACSPSTSCCARRVSTARGCRCPTTPPPRTGWSAFIGRDPAWRP